MNQYCIKYQTKDVRLKFDTIHVHAEDPMTGLIAFQKHLYFWH